MKSIIEKILKPIVEGILGETQEEHNRKLSEFIKAVNEEMDALKRENRETRQRIDKTNEVLLNVYKDTSTILKNNAKTHEKLNGLADELLSRFDVESLKKFIENGES